MWGATVNDRRGLRILAAAALVAFSCFSADAVEGLPCSSDDGCGADQFDEFVCVAGYCRANGTDALAGCGDDDRVQGEYCFDDEVTVFDGMGVDLRGFALADVDGDDDTDVVLSTEGGLQLRINDVPSGAGFTEVAIELEIEAEALATAFPEIDVPDELLPIPVGPGAIATGALGDNGFPDAVFSVRGLELPPILEPLAAPIVTHLWVGRNSGTVGDLTVSPLLVTQGLGGKSIAHGGIVLADVDADGDDDMLVVYAEPDDQTGDTLGAMFIASAPGEFAEGYEISTGGGKSLPLVADLDGDGDLEVVVISGPHAHAAILNDGLLDASIAPALLDLDSEANNGALGDIDGDGVLDLVVGYMNAERVDLFLGAGDGTFGDAIALPSVDVEGLAIADLDGDGHQDLVVSDGNSVFVQAGFSTTAVGAPVEVIGSDARFVLTLDINGDAVPDVLGEGGGRARFFVANP